MIASILLTILFIFTLRISIKKKNLNFNYSSLSTAIREGSSKPFSDSNPILYLSFFLFLILPFFWGLAFYLKTDANVVVVLLGFTWVYNWIKYIFQLGKN